MDEPLRTLGERQEAVASALHLARWAQREEIEATTSFVVTIPLA